MKTILKLIFILAVLPLSSVAADMADYDNTAIVAGLKGSESDRKAAVKMVLANTAQAESATLFFASIHAYSFGQLEDAGFLFYAAQMRAVFDMRRFMEDRGAALSTMQNQIGNVINPEIVRNPKVYASIVERLENWDLTTGKNYHPGWEVGSRVLEAEELSMIKEIKDDVLKDMRLMAKLLQDTEYFSALLVYQDFNLASKEEQQDTERIAKKKAAEETLLRVEKRNGLFVLSNRLRSGSKEAEVF